MSTSSWDWERDHSIRSRPASWERDHSIRSSRPGSWERAPSIRSIRPGSYRGYFYEDRMDDEAHLNPSLSTGKEDGEGAAEEEQGERRVHGLKWVFVCAAVYIAIFTYGLDTTIAADVQTSVVETFCEVEQLSWLGTGFMLGSVATILPIGAMFGLFSIKWNFIVYIIIFEVGSAVCGAAPNMNALIVGRVIAGIGGSGVYLGALTYMTAVTVPRERGGYIAGVGLCWGTGAVLGPVIGGAFAGSSATWRWAFYINLLIAAVCAPVYLTMPDIVPMPGVPVMSKLKTLDYVGIVLNAGLWCSFAILFTFGGAQWAWDGGQTIAMFVVLGVLLIAFGVQQYWAILTTTANRIFPVHLLKSRMQVLFFICTAANTSALFVPIYYIPVYSAYVNGDSPILSAVRLLPFLIISMGMNLVVGILIPKIKMYAPMYLVSGIFIVAGSAPLYLWTQHTPLSYIYGLSSVVAFGAGLMLQTGYTLAGVKLAQAGHPEQIPQAIGLQNVGQIGGGTIALIVANRVFQSRAVQMLGDSLSEYHLSQTDLYSAIAGTTSDVFQRISPESADEARYDITRAMANVWIMMIAAGGVLIVCSGLMKWEKVEIS